MSSRFKFDADVAVIGAGVIGCSVAYALSREGHKVVLLDRGDVGLEGASYGNAGHIASELVQPLPSLSLLLGCWRFLTSFGGPAKIDRSELRRFISGSGSFVRAAFARDRNTRVLRPLVEVSTDAMWILLRDIRRSELLRRNGHYQFWLGRDGPRKAAAEAALFSDLAVATAPVSGDLLRAVAARAGVQKAAGLFFPGTGHVVDPRGVCLALANAARRNGAAQQRFEVKALRAAPDGVLVQGEGRSLVARSVIVCAGAWAKPLLHSVGIRAPLMSARGYHVELPGENAVAEGPCLYMDSHTLVTPMRGRLRATSFMEFAAPSAPIDPLLPRRLRQNLKQLGYECENPGPIWVGPRPVLPDFLPGIGRSPMAPNVFYAVGHQQLGLTLAPVTGRLVADMVAGRPPVHDIRPFDLKRFG